MKYVTAFLLFSNILFAQNNNSTTQFKTLQDDLVTQNWDLAINGIFLSDNLALTARQFEYANFEIAMIEVPILLKIRITDKLSLLSGAKLDFYRVPQGMSAEVGISASTGLQYDFNKDSYIQGVFSYQINQTSNLYDYNYGSPTSFMLRSGFKF